MSHRSTSSTGKPGGEVFFPAITQKAAENMCQTRSSLVFELVVTPFCGVQYELYSPCVGKNMLLCVDFFVDFRLSLPVEFRTKMGWSRFNFWHRHNINPSLRHCWKVLQIRKKKTSQYSDEIEKSKYHLTGVSWSHVCAVNVSTPFCQWNQIVLLDNPGGGPVLHTSWRPRSTDKGRRESQSLGCGAERKHWNFWEMSKHAFCLLQDQQKQYIDDGYICICIYIDITWIIHESI